eukprot:m.123284 g.123284  ORF g.123284 m.123284 type:complete len:442 (+) comp28978_c0_seq1:430-1755(+)
MSQPLSGWLWKMGAKGLVRTYKWRYFSYDEFTGNLNYFKTEDKIGPPLGYIDIAACRSIETTDPEMKQFKLNLPTRTWILLTNTSEEMLYWMEELLNRKVARQKSNGVHEIDESKEEEDDEEFDPNAPNYVDTSVPPLVDNPGAPTLPTKRVPSKVDGAKYDQNAWLPVEKEDEQSNMDSRIQDAVGSMDLSRSSEFGIVEDTPSPAPAPTPIESDFVAVPELVDLIPQPEFSPHVKKVSEQVSERFLSKKRKELKDAERLHQTEVDKLRQEIEALQAQLEVAKRKVVTTNQENAEVIATMQAEFETFDRESEQKSKLMEIIRKQLKTEQASRREQMRSGISFDELRDRLFKSQTELAHTRAMLDLQNHRMAGSMELIAYLRSVLDGADAMGNDKERELLMEQLQSADQACSQSEDRNQELQAQLYEFLNIRSRESSQRPS